MVSVIYLKIYTSWSGLFEMALVYSACLCPQSKFWWPPKAHVCISTMSIPPPPPPNFFLCRCCAGHRRHSCFWSGGGCASVREVGRRRKVRQPQWPKEKARFRPTSWHVHISRKVREKNEYYSIIVPVFPLSSNGAIFSTSGKSQSLSKKNCPHIWALMLASVTFKFSNPANIF